MSIIRIEDPKVFIGLSADAARKEVLDHGYDVRVIRQDSRQGALIKFDYDPLRITLFIEKDQVVDATIG